jgi:glycosyltransferase involved in cell wall biosynthesis
MIQVTHIITGLNMGGAETMLFKLLKAKPEKCIDYQVIALDKEGFYASHIRALGIATYSINLKKNWIKGILKILFLCKNVDVLQTWMYHSDLIGFLVRVCSLKRKKLVWNIRHGNIDADKNKASTLFIVKINAFLSKWVDLIVTCSKAAKYEHIKNGYAKERFCIIPNGFQTEFDEEIVRDRNNFDRNLNIDNPKAKILLQVARWHVQKGHHIFLGALRQLLDNGLNVIGVMCGKDIDSENEALQEIIEELGIENNVILLGVRTDTRKLMLNSDLLVNPSFGEAFPNVIGEAMVLRLLCVATDVGDTAEIIGNRDFIVPPGNVSALFGCLMDSLSLSEEERASIVERQFQRVKVFFGIEKVASKYISIYKSRSINEIRRFAYS